MAQLHTVLFGDMLTVRVNQTFAQPEMATDLLEHDITKLNKLRQRGRDSFADYEAEIEALIQ